MQGSKRLFFGNWYTNQSIRVILKW